LDAETNAPALDLASSGEVGTDGVTYTYKL